MGEWRIEQLGRQHVRKGFDRGKPTLNDFLQTLVNQYDKRDLCRTSVAVHGADDRVLGYYTMVSGAIDADGLPEKDKRTLPRHPVPMVLIARLAVDRTVQGQGLGGILLRGGLSRSLKISTTTGFHAVVVDALDSDAKAFYEKYGFVPLTDNVMRLFVNIETTRGAAQK